jgi:hypothetical protein
MEVQLHPKYKNLNICSTGREIILAQALQMNWSHESSEMEDFLVKRDSGGYCQTEKKRETCRSTPFLVISFVRTLLK